MNASPGSPAGGGLEAAQRVARQEAFGPLEARFGPLARAVQPRALGEWFGGPAPTGAFGALPHGDALLAVQASAFEDRTLSAARETLARSGARFAPGRRPEELRIRIEVAALADLAAGERGRGEPAGLCGVLAAAWCAALEPPPAPALMGVLNTTPDSFSDGGRWLDVSAALEQARRMAAEGALWIDVGGESTRPGAPAVSAEEEWERLGEVLRGLAAERPARISIDTHKAAVAARALDLGAELVNDVTAGRGDGALLPLVAERGAALCLMHMRGDPRSMQKDPRYGDAPAEIAAFLRERAADALAAGIAPEKLYLDPGLGFGKLPGHNLELLARLGELRSLGLPLLVGASRKSFLGHVTGEADPLARDPASAAAGVAALLAGAALLRVHAVAPHRQALDVARSVRDAGGMGARMEPGAR